MESQVRTILVVDDDEDHLALVERYVTAYGAECVVASCAAKAMEYLKVGNISAMVTDMVMPGLNGMELLTFTKKQYPHVDVMIMTGYSGHYSYVDVIKAGATDFIAKPFKKDEFSAKLDRLFRERDLLKKLQESKEKSESASKAKSAFLCTVSHELITPMNGLLGFVSLLKDSDLPPEEKEFVEMVSISSDRLMRIINQILDFSNVEDGDGKFMPSHCSLASICDELLERHAPFADQKGLDLSIKIDESLQDILLFIDKDIITRILGILLENAIRFTDSGSVKISSRLLEKATADRARIEFAIRDSGCGIPLEKQDEIFAPFTQVDDYMTRKHEGAGLGLAICRKLVGLMDGKLRMENNKPQGATFYVSFDVKMA